ncbi:regulatory protein RecX [Microbacterium sp. HJ5]
MSDSADAGGSGSGDESPCEGTPAQGSAGPSDESDGDGAETSWHPTWAADRPASADDDPDRAVRVDAAEKALLKKLRTRSLSVSEARSVLREHELDAAATDQVLASLEDYGYLDDAALAEQLVHAGVERKGQGRQVIAQTMAKRGIPRDVADAAIAALPDDDLERALEFARTKARSLGSLDRDTALRRLTGQLARRGYGGSVASRAARAALDESPGHSSGVGFR